MKPLMTIALALLVSASPAFADGGLADDDDDRGRSACERTAGKMFNSCRFEANEEFAAGIGICLNLGAPAAKRRSRNAPKRARAARSSGRPAAIFANCSGKIATIRKPS